jgi:hypothetical protein
MIEYAKLKDTLKSGFPIAACAEAPKLVVGGAEEAGAL